MPNPLKGEVPLTLPDGREFTLVLDFEALISAEALYGKPLAVLMTDADKGFAGACRSLLFGALRAHHGKVTPSQAAAIFMENMENVAAALADAAAAGFPDKAEGKDGKNPPRRGKHSGGSGAKSASTKKGSSGQRRAHTN